MADHLCEVDALDALLRLGLQNDAPQALHLRWVWEVLSVRIEDRLGQARPTEVAVRAHRPPLAISALTSSPLAWLMDWRLLARA